MSKVCNQYVGSACIDGNCPKAHVEEFLERGIDIIKSCNECVFIKSAKIVRFMKLNIVLSGGRNKNE